MRRRCCCRKCAPGLGPRASFSYGQTLIAPCTVSLLGNSTASPGRTIAYGEWFKNDETTPFATGYPVQGGVLINPGDDIRLRVTDNYGCSDEVAQAVFCVDQQCRSTIAGNMGPPPQFFPMAIDFEISGAIGNCYGTGTEASVFNRAWTAYYVPFQFGHAYPCLWLTEPIKDFDCAGYNGSIYQVQGRPADPYGWIRGHVTFLGGILMRIQFLQYRYNQQGPGIPLQTQFTIPFVYGVTQLTDFIGYETLPLDGNGWNAQPYGTHARIKVTGMS